LVDGHPSFLGGESGAINTGTYQPDFSGSAFGAFPSNNGINGFKPMGEGGSTNWGFKPASGSPGMMGESEDYLDDEERERVERV
jgi:hypothetical protein